MKTRYKLLGVLATALLAFSSCSEETVTVEIPSDISNLQSFSGSGNIKLKWELPADSNLFYVEVRYKDPKSNENVKRHISKYADSLLISGLLNKYGPIDFQVQSYSMSGGTNQTHSITETSSYAPVDTLYHVTQLTLSTDNVTTNAQEPREGPLANLFDGNTSTFFHSAWSLSIADAHHLEFDLGKPLSAFQYETANRSNANNMPLAVDFYGSNDKSNWVKIASLSGGMPEEAIAVYRSPVLLFDDAYQYIRFIPTKIKNNTKYFALSVFKAYEVQVEIRDPEKD
ncbi:MAG: discoidin domain-containing protein [Bacteroidales bacterium]